MAGIPANVQSRLWSEADVLLWLGSTPPTEADLPEAITDPFDTGDEKWGFLGLLVGESGLEQNRNWDEKKITAWGYGVVAAPVKDFVLETKVSALEDNAVMQKIMWPGSTATSIVVPKPLYAHYALEKRTATGGKHRAISAERGKFWVPTIKDAEGDAPPREVTVTAFPSPTMELYKVQQQSAA
jgi:hypothetical protein